MVVHERRVTWSLAVSSVSGVPRGGGDMGTSHRRYQRESLGAASSAKLELCGPVPRPLVPMSYRLGIGVAWTGDATGAL